MISVQVSGGYDPSTNTNAQNMIVAIGQRYHEDPVVEVNRNLRTTFSVTRWVLEPNAAAFEETIFSLATECGIDLDDIETDEAHGAGAEG